MLYRLVINPQQIEQNQKNIKLDKSQQHYLRNVVRLNDNDDFIVLDGQGNCWRSKLTNDGARIVETLKEDRELSIVVTLMVALPKGNGFETIIRCTTELGVACIQPVISKRTLLKPNANKWNRWRKIAQEGSEQSERQIVPEIKAPILASEAFNGVNNPNPNSNVRKYIAFARSQTPHLQHFLKQDFSLSLSSSLPSQIIIATGCEGGWTQTEVEQAISVGFQEVSLGKRILRSVTAPIMAMSTIASLLESDLII